MRDLFFFKFDQAFGGGWRTWFVVCVFEVVVVVVLPVLDKIIWGRTSSAGQCQNMIQPQEWPCVVWEGSCGPVRRGKAS